MAQAQETIEKALLNLYEDKKVIWADYCYLKMLLEQKLEVQHKEQGRLLEILKIANVPQYVIDTYSSKEPDPDAIEWAKQQMNKVGRGIDNRKLRQISESIDETLAKETPESLEKWFKDHE